MGALANFTWPGRVCGSFIIISTTTITYWNAHWRSLAVHIAVAELCQCRPRRTPIRANFGTQRKLLPRISDVPSGWRYLPSRLPPSPRRSRVVNSCCRRASLPRAALSLSSSSVRPSGSGPGFVGFVIVARLAPQSAAAAPPPPEVAGREMSQRTCWTVALCASSIVDVGQSPLPSSWSHCSTTHACGDGDCMVRKTRDPLCYHAIPTCSTHANVGASAAGALPCVFCSTVMS